jgi:hypothetical protein
MGLPTFRWALIILEGFCPSCEITNQKQHPELNIKLNQHTNHKCMEKKHM